MTIDWQKVESMTSEEIENLRVEQLKELQTIENMTMIVQDEYDAKSKQMIILEGEKKDLSINLRKARHNIKQKKTDIDILQTKMWQARR